jgi:hypothetical protein
MPCPYCPHCQPLSATPPRHGNAYDRPCPGCGWDYHRSAGTPVDALFGGRCTPPEGAAVAYLHWAGLHTIEALRAAWPPRRHIFGLGPAQRARITAALERLPAT